MSNVAHGPLVIKSCGHIYCKRITFGDVFFLAPLAVEYLHQSKYTAKYVFEWMQINHQIKFALNNRISKKRQKYNTFTVAEVLPIGRKSISKHNQCHLRLKLTNVNAKIFASLSAAVHPSV